MRAIRCVILVSALAAAVPAASASQSPKLPGVGRGTTLELSKLEVYQETLRRYCAGDTTAVDDLLAWKQEQLHLAVNLINTPPDPMRPWALKDIKAAVLMHTEAALRLLTERPRELEMSAQLEVATRVLVRGAHPILPVAGREIEERNAAVRAFASRWYVAVSRLLRDRILFNAARKVLALGRDRLPGDAPVLYESGTMEEFVATHSSERFTPVAVGRMALLYSDTVARTLLARHDQQLNDAERWLRDSITRDPVRVEAQLHLGRVLMLLGRDDASARLLETIKSPGAADAVYLALMFRAAMHERRSALDLASETYRRAAAVMPAAQSAPIALSQLLQRQGRGDESRALLDQLLARNEPPADPWWTYFFEPGENVVARVKALFLERDR